MRKFLVFLGFGVLFFITLNFINCAAMFNSGGGKVSFNSNPAGAEVIVDGQSLGTTPVKLDLNRKVSHQIIIKKDGKEKAFVLNNKVGAGWVVLDVIAGLVPVVVDAATGAWYSITPKEVTANLQ